ncbi:MAG: hypothetical protein ACLP0H_05725 [Terriglobales bacterium]
MKHPTRVGTWQLQLQGKSSESYSADLDLAVAGEGRCQLVLSSQHAASEKKSGSKPALV